MGVKKSRTPSRQLQSRKGRSSGGPDVWQRLTQLVGVVAMAGVGVLVLSVFVPEWDKLRQMDEVNERLAQRRDSLIEQKSERLHEEQRGRADQEYIELIARDRLNLQRPGETIIRIDRSDFAGS